MSFWCFVFLSRCLIYKVHATAFQLSVRYILAHSLSLVKYFFQKFFRFLLSSTLIQARSPFQRNSFILPHSFESVKNFFQVFSVLSAPNCLISVLFELVPLSRANLFSLPHAFRFVKHFFQARSSVRPASARSHLRFLPYFSCPPVRRSTIIPSSTTFVNTFFLFLCCVFTGHVKRPSP